MLHDARDKFSELPRGVRRIIFAVLLFVDANFLGTLNGYGSLNILDMLLGDALPNDMVWLIQLIESITAGFVVIKVLFDDVPSSPLRTLSLLLSPFFMVAVTFYSLDLLLQGLGASAGFTLDLVSITTGTLTWSSTYLAIAIGLTLTYKVQRYGNFAQSELFMIGMYLSMIMIWSDYFFPMTSLSTTKDGVLTWSVLIFTLIAAFILTGFAGIIIDRLVYKGFRKTQASPQVMMIASLGVALILRALTYMRFGAGRNMFEPEGDWRMPNLRWELPTTKMRFNLGERNLEEGRTYTQWTCEETIDETTGESVLTRIVSDTSKPAIELYDTTADCVTQATTNYAYYKGAVPVVMFSAVLLLMLLLNKTRLGRRMRAVADNPELAASSGINVERVHMTSAFLSAGISGMGGAIFALTLRFNPETAFTLLLPSFAIIVLGTIGSIPGAILGSLVVGFVRALSSPVLIGIGLPLGRSNYSALDGVMPYIFLVAILMIMPEGIGDAYEKWKIDSLRKRKEYDPDKSDKITASLAILPTGIFGLHHWWRNRTDKMQNFSAFVIAAYAFHRFSDFVGRNSFANGCGDVCQNDEFVDSNLAVLTGRSDGTLLLEDSPLDDSDLLSQKSPPDGLTPAETDEWTANALSEMKESWLSQMNFEIDLVNFIVDLGDILWPWAFILLWIYSIYEGISILQGKYETQGSQNVTVKINEVISSISMRIRKLQNQILLRWSDFDRKHDQFVKHIRGRISQSSSGITAKVGTKAGNFYSNVLDKLPLGSDKDKQNLRNYGRESPIGSWLLFGLLMFILILFLAWLPIAESDDFRFKKVLQVSNVLLTLSIFILMSFSLNLHTGYTGMVNFGVIFFVAIGTITVGILTAPENLHGYDWAILPAVLIALLLAAAFGWALAYPTARLRTDYFAIVTISLGEIVRVLLAGEPLLRVGAVGNAIGISSYPLPFEDRWFCGSETSGPDTNWVSPDACRDDPNLTDTPAYLIGEWLNLGEPAPYMFLLMIMSVVAVILVWILLNRILSSPWGRILKAIREDEEVAQHHGHDVLTHKAASLALGASIAALAGAFWAWKLTGFEPSFMSPARSTFLVWAAFIIGGTSNNRGMVVGAFIIVLMEFVFNVLVAGQGSADLPLHTTAARIDSFFEWLILSPWEVASIFLIAAFVGFAIRSERILESGLAGVAIFSFTAVALGQRSIDESFFGGVVSADMLYFKLFLIGCLMLFSLKFNTKGLLPEVPVRPERPKGGEAVE
ncbi:MAG: ABC transporter permease [Candidatus Thalassarchaeaceae archaeon]